MLTLLLALGVGVPPAYPSTDAEAAARELAARLVEDAHREMTRTDTGKAERFAALTGVISDDFDFDIWERFLLGDIADAFTDEQRKEFRALLPGFLARLYFDQFGKGLEAKPVIAEARTVRRDVLVKAAIPRANGRKLPVDWRIRNNPEKGPLVIDVMVGGTSFLILKREEFRAVFKKSGAAGLLDHVRSRARAE